MSTAERIYELVRTLPEAQANEVLDFVEFIQQRYKQAVIAPSKPQLLPLPVLEGVVPQGWKDAIYE